MAKLRDAELVEQRVDLDHLFREHYGRLVRALGVACGDVELAADAVQEAFVRAHVHRRKLRRYDDPVGWVRRVAVNLLHDEHRRAGRKRRALTRLAAQAAEHTPAPTEPDQLAELLAGMPPQQRIAAALHYVDGLTVAEVADAMSIADGTVKSHLHAARTTLRGLVAADTARGSRT
jgi:RNA polymerase sigma-70 factor, ECF subfamily